MAKALDVIGDRWSLLIVRELLLQGPCRYTDLQHGLPGIATNLLAGRLRDLEAAGVLERHVAPPPVATTLFGLTPRGEALRPVVEELGRWGAPLLGDGVHDGEAFRSHWITLPLELYYYDPTPGGPPVTIEARFPDGPMLIESAGGTVRARRRSAEQADVVLSGASPLIVGVLSGRLALEDARRQGLEIRGDESALGRVRSSSTEPRA